MRTLTALGCPAAAGLLVIGLAAPAAAAPSVRVTPSSGVAAGGETLTVTGSGFNATAGGQVGVYVVFGPRRADYSTNSGNYLAAAWVHPGGSGDGQAAMSASGSFTVRLSVKSVYTDSDGRAVDCAKTPCYVITMAAHGSRDRSQDTFTQVVFKGAPSAGNTDGTGGGRTTTGARTSLSPRAMPTTTATTAASGESPSQPAAATPVAAGSFRQTAAGAPAMAPWPFWLAVAGVAGAAYAVRRVAARRH